MHTSKQAVSDAMRCVGIVLIVATCCLSTALTSALADGGVVRLVERHGDYQISVFTAPVPMRAGPVDISVLVQDASNGQPVAGVQTKLTLTPADGDASPIHATATTAAATNKLFQAAIVELPRPGTWQVQVASTAAGTPLVAEFTIHAAPPPPDWSSQWLWFTWPAAAVALFGVHRCLVARAAGRSCSRRPIAT